jgi:hypothetical protein
MSKVGVATKEELDKAKAQLDKIFYSPEFVMGSLPKLWAIAKNRTEIPFRVVKGYYDNQAVVQIFKRTKKPQRMYPIQTTKPLNIIFMDTMVIDGFYIINTIDLFSKYASSMVFKKAVSSSDAVKALKAFLHEAKTSLDNVNEIRHDGGPEFSKQFAKYTEDKTIKSLPYAKTQMSPVERFNGTLRRMIEKLKAVEGKPISWAYKYVPRAVKAYNNLPHSSTGYMPSELIASKEAQRKVLMGQRTIPSMNDGFAKRTQSQSDYVKAGDTVRISIRDEMNPFDHKIAPNFSTELYKVVKVRGNRVKLEDGNELLDHQVMVIDPDLLMNASRVKVVDEDKQTKKVERDLGKEMRKLADYNKQGQSDIVAKQGKRQRKVKQVYDV